MIVQTYSIAFLAIVLFAGQQGASNESKAERMINDTSSQQVVTHIITKEQQAALTPDAVLQDLMQGNQRFQTGNITRRDHSKQARQSAEGQFPKAVVLSCLDSRVPVEDIFDQGLGDIFVLRIAGNFVNQDILGSMEFACRLSGAKLILVMGHQHCGALKGAIDDLQLGNITAMLANIKPAVSMSHSFAGEQISKNDDFVKYVSKNNVRLAIKNIQEKSPILKAMAEKSEIKIVGAFYYLADGTFEFIP